MEHIVTAPRAPFLTSDGRLEIHQIPAWKDNLVWLVRCTSTGSVAAVDGPDATAALAYCQARQWTLDTILNTHTHGDHIGINKDLGRRGFLSTMTVYGPAKKAAAVPGLTHPINDGDTVRIGDVSGQVWLTEGHIDGHVSFLFDDVLFCGDTLFAGGCGFLFDGPPKKMYDSLRRLSGLPAETKVCCAHEYTEDNLRFARSVEPNNQALAERIVALTALRAEGGCSVPSTIGEERATNPFLRWASSELVESLAAAWPGRSLDGPEEIFAATRALKDRKDYRRASAD